MINLVIERTIVLLYTQKSIPLFYSTTRTTKYKRTQLCTVSKPFHERRFHVSIHHHVSHTTRQISSLIFVKTPNQPTDHPVNQQDSALFPAHTTMLIFLYFLYFLLLFFSFHFLLSFSQVNVVASPTPGTTLDTFFAISSLMTGK